MLAVIQDWTLRPEIRNAMLTSGLADFGGIARLVVAVRLALENQRRGLSEVQASAVILQMLATKKVRKAIARHVAGQYGLTKWEVTRDLKAMLEEVMNRVPEERSH
jgi:hypothetical protein